MKKSFLLSMLLISCINSMAQFKLSGTVSGFKYGDTIIVNIPFVYGFYRENSHKIAVNESGEFSATLPVSEARFAWLEFGGRQLSLLLSPKKTLVLDMSRDAVCSSITGTAAAENKLLYQLKMGEIPFFNKGNHGQDNVYAGMDLPTISQKLLMPWRDTINKRIALINKSSLPAPLKARIMQEVRSSGVVHLVDFARGVMDRSHRGRNDSLILSIFKDASITPQVLPAGPQYYSFADQYLGYFETQITLAIARDKKAGDDMIMKYYHISIDSIKSMVNFKGKAYMNWVGAKYNYDKRVTEALLAQAIAVECADKNLAQAKPLMDDFEVAYPHSIYLASLRGKMSKLNSLLTANSNNAAIQIASGYDKMTSIYQAIGGLKGKVVYLDIWGTWCGPCKEELTYNPELKQHFKDKDVAFVYLDMDEDAKDAQWQQFVKLNGMTGLHLRKNGKAIQPFWDELMIDKEKQGRYPTYFIFDKDGKLVEADAKRPSDKAELYKQIEKYL